MTGKPKLQAFVSTSTNVLHIRNWRTLLHIGAAQALRVHSPGGNTFLREITSWLPSRECVTLNRKSDSVNRCIFTLGLHFCQISSRSDLKRRSFSVFNHYADYLDYKILYFVEICT